ncbi:phage holin family protein [Phormidium tenue FACHB-886]|nr:phage holin family protein [Phormidium tenue FACHB-886]
MGDLILFIVAAIVTAISLIIISKIPFLGVEIDSVSKALISGLIFGLLTAFVKPILSFLAAPITFLTFGLFAFVINVIIFGLAAKLVEGFRLRNGFVSAILGAIALSIINSILFQILGSIGLIPAVV